MMDPFTRPRCPAVKADPADSRCHAPPPPPTGSWWIDPDSPRPLHRQVYDGLRGAIVDGRLAAGARIQGGAVPHADYDLIEQQKAYYRVRAGEYDEWFLRQGRYDHGPEFRARWEREVDEVRSALERFRPAGRVLELACGTGWWTEQLVRWADELTAVDASDEVLALNAERVRSSRVTRVQADLFAWTPDGGYDVVFFSFWLSHVPPARFEAFWAMVRGALNPGGRVFFVDSLRTELSTASDHVLPDEGDIIAERKLNDGSRYSIFKVFYDPAQLQTRLEALGWRASVTSTDSFFLYGELSRA